MKRGSGLIIAVLLLTLLFPGRAYGEEPMDADAAIGDGVEAWMRDIDWQALNDIVSELPEGTRALWSGMTASGFTEDVALSGTDAGLALWDGDTLLSIGGRALLDTCGALAGTLATLVGLLLIGAMSAALHEGGKNGMQGAAAFVCRCFTLSISLAAFLSAAKCATDCVERLCRCMDAAMPVLMTLLTAVGGVTSAGVLQPAMALLTGGVAKSLQTIVVPLLLCAGVLAMFDHLSERIRLNEMSALLHSAVKWCIGVVTTLYTAVTMLRGMTAAAFDGVSVRTAKYVAGGMFPMVGGLISGSFDTVLGCAGLVKNAAGLATILLTVSVAAEPILRIAATMLLFRLTAAVLQPVAEKNQIAMCRAGANMLSGLLAACAAVTAMFIVTVGLTVALGNAGMMG